MKLLLRWIINAAILVGIAYFLPGVEISGPYAALVTALILGIVNALIRPIIILLTLPINIVSLGLFTLIINGFLFWLTSTIAEGFEVTGFWAAFLGALLFSVFTSLVGEILKDQK